MWQVKEHKKNLMLLDAYINKNINKSSDVTYIVVWNEFLLVLNVDRNVPCNIAYPCLSDMKGPHPYSSFFPKF